MAVKTCYGNINADVTMATKLKCLQRNLQEKFLSLVVIALTVLKLFNFLARGALKAPNAPPPAGLNRFKAVLYKILDCF